MQQHCYYNINHHIIADLIATPYYKMIKCQLLKRQTVSCYLMQVNETNKGSYFRTLKDDECPLQVQSKWAKANEWSFWLIKKEVTDSPTFEFRPTRHKQLEIPVDVSYLNSEYSVLTIPMSDDCTCAEVIEKVRMQFDLQL